MAKNCNASQIYEYRKLYPYDETITLFSSLDATRPTINTIDSLDEYISSLCDDTAAPQKRLLLPITSIDAMTNKDEIFVHSVDFVAYDTGITIDAEIEDSDKSYANEIVKGNATSSIWQPNWCRPSVRIGGEELASGLANPTVENTYFDNAIGIPLPYCMQINKVVKNPRDIQISAALAQAYKEEGKWRFRNYPLLAILNFWHRL